MSGSPRIDTRLGLVGLVYMVLFNVLWLRSADREESSFGVSVLSQPGFAQPGRGSIRAQAKPWRSVRTG